MQSSSSWLRAGNLLFLRREVYSDHKLSWNWKPSSDLRVIFVEKKDIWKNRNIGMPGGSYQGGGDRGGGGGRKRLPSTLRGGPPVSWQKKIISYQHWFSFKYQYFLLKILNIVRLLYVKGNIIQTSTLFHRYVMQCL